jgi:hypothetical protein
MTVMYSALIIFSEEIPIETVSLICLFMTLKNIIYIQIHIKNNT